MGYTGNSLVVSESSKLIFQSVVFVVDTASCSCRRYMGARILVLVV